MNTITRALFREADLIAPLLGFKPFARFYRQQRPKVRSPIAWSIEPSLGADLCAGVAGCNSPQADGAVLIRLARLPRTFVDAHTVAHEVTHSLLDQEGWPSVGYLPGAPANARELAMRLNMLLDVEIDRRLMALGFVGAELRDKLATIELVVPHLAGPHAPQVLARWRRDRSHTTPAGLRRLYGQLLGVVPAAMGQWLTVKE